jgi:hypothetical protein
LPKICEARNIPVPPRGYWAKLAHGKKVKQPALPPASPGDDGRILFHQAPNAVEQPPKPPEPPEIEFERQPENEIVVPERLGKVHPLVEKTRAALKACRPSEWSRSLVFDAECLDVRVSPASLPRALRIMQALIEALEQRGYKVSLHKRDRHRGIAVSMFGERVVFHLVERTKQVVTGKDYPRYELVPNGRLCFQIGDWWPTPSLTDGTTKRLENRLNEFVVKLLEEAFDEQRRREERDREEAQRQERERLRAIEEEKRREEAKKIKQWDEWMTAWKRARQVRAFARAIRRAHSPIREGSNIATWLQWADGYANSIDPLRPVPEEDARSSS